MNSGELTTQTPIKSQDSTTSYDPVNNPSHYMQGKYQAWEVIEDWNLGFHEANVVKYINRAPHKGNELQDLKKALRYLERKVMLLEKEASEND